MRVIAGRCRSLPLRTLPGRNTRPTVDRIKETLFNILQTDVPGSRFLDLFAGSGAIGIEALSRGAESCCFVEKNADAVRVINENLRFTKLADQAEVLKMDAIAAIRVLETAAPFDIVFMDPPYLQGLEKAALEAFDGAACVTDDTLFVVEASLEDDFGWLDNSAYTCLKCKKYKTNQHLFLKRK